MTKPRRARMSVEDRRNQLLDSAVGLILKRGLSNCTLEEVAAAAGISKALIYKHFSRREELLKELLEREYRILRAWNVSALPRDPSLEAVVRISLQRIYEYLYERGPIVRALLSDRAVSDLIGSRDKDERARSTDYFTARTMRTYNLPKEVALIGSIINTNAPSSAARALKSFGIPPQRVAEVWTTFMMGGWAAVSAVYGGKEPVEVEETAASGRTRKQR